jgi:putative endonuclease
VFIISFSLTIFRMSSFIPLQKYRKSTNSAIPKNDDLCLFLLAYGIKMLHLQCNIKDMAEHNDLGKWGEEKAVQYLMHKGYTIRDRDWRYGHRDLDVVAVTEDCTTLVIVEVKTRSSAELVGPEEAVDRRKIRNLARATNDYVKLFGIENNVRFDIISIVGDNDSNMKIEHIVDAFNPMLI